MLPICQERGRAEGYAVTNGFEAAIARPLPGKHAIVFSKDAPFQGVRDGLLDSLDVALRGLGLQSFRPQYGIESFTEDLGSFQAPRSEHGAIGRENK
jgi:hypothetical protein